MLELEDLTVINNTELTEADWLIVGLREHKIKLFYNHWVNCACEAYVPNINFRKCIRLKGHTGPHVVGSSDRLESVIWI